MYVLILIKFILGKIFERNNGCVKFECFEFLVSVMVLQVAAQVNQNVKKLEDETISQT